MVAIACGGAANQFDMLVGGVEGAVLHNIPPPHNGSGDEQLCTTGRFRTIPTEYPR